jgi:hypothetical protein
VLEEDAAVRIEDVVRLAAPSATAIASMPDSLPSISTNVPTGVSSTATMTSACANSSRYFS